MMRPVLLAIAAAAAGSAQRLATNGDASIGWMQSAWYLPGDAARGSGESFIYRFDGEGAALLARSASPFDTVSSPSVTSDGRVVSWLHSRFCRIFCPSPGAAAEFAGLDPGTIRIGRLWLTVSRNGHWAVTPGFPFGISSTNFALQNVESGEVWTSPDAPKLTFPPGPIDVARDGTVIGLLGGALVLWRPESSPVTILEGRLPSRWGLSSSGRRAWLAFGEIGRREELVWADLASGSKIVMAPRWPDWVRMDQTGDTALLPSEDNRAILRFEAASGETAPLINAAEGFRDAALSDDGGRAWVMTSRNELLRLEVAARRTDRILEGLPDTLRTVSPGVPGSAMEISLGDFNAAAFDIRVAGESFPIVDLAAGRVVMQVPWNFDVQPRGDGFPEAVPITARRQGNPFESRGVAVIYLLSVYPLFAYAEPPLNPLVKAAHQDFRSLVSPASPARPGETVHLWLFGLGPLDRHVSTGEPAPADPPAKPLAPVACYLLGSPEGPPTTALQLPYVAYAPGLIGVYQVDAAIPDAWPAGVHKIRCEAAGRLTPEGEIPVGPP